MVMSVDKALGIAPHALAIRGARAQVLGNNLAHADTPGYLARDVDFKTALAEATRTADGVRVRTSQPGHIDPLGGPDGSAVPELKYRAPFAPALDGNTVETHVEQTQFAENSVQFLTALRVLNGRINGVITALKGE